MPKPEQGPKQGGRRPPKRVWLGVRVSQTFHRRIRTECARRDLSIQELLAAALKWFFETPRKDWSHADVTFHLEDPGPTKKEVAEEDAWLGLWEQYITKMPREKIEVLASAMQWDLRTLKSSRRKPSAWKRHPQEEGA